MNFINTKKFTVQCKFGTSDRDEEWNACVRTLKSDQDSFKFFGHVSWRFLERAIFVGRLAGKLGFDGNTRGTGDARRGTTLTSCFVLVAVTMRRLSCARRLSKHPIVLSVFRPRVRHFFFRGICQDAPSVPLERREVTRSLPPLLRPTTSELQRPRLSLTVNRIADITVGTPTNPSSKWRCLEF